MNNFREKYIDLFHFNEELREIIEPVLDKHPEPKDRKQFFLLYALTKSYKTQVAILLLGENGFGQDAGILSRSIFELAIITLYIVKDDTEKNVERFFDYDCIARAKMYNSVSEEMRYKEEFKKRDPVGITIKEMLEEAERIEKKYRNIKSNRWSEEGFKDIAEKVGRLDAYKTVYALQCNLTHPNPRNMNDYLSISEGRLEVNAGPDDKWISESLVATFDFLSCIIDAWNKEFKLGLEGKLDDLAKRYSEKIGKINKERDKNETLQY